MSGEWPDYDEVRRLIGAGGLTGGAECDALSEYLTQTCDEWEREVDRENAAKVFLSAEMEVLGFCSKSQAEAAEQGYAAALVKRVEAILQNHRS